MARHSEDECAYCRRDLLPLSYLVGDDQQLYCSPKCAEAGEQRANEDALILANLLAPTDIETILT